MVAMVQISLWFKTRHDWGWAGIWLIHGFQQRGKFCEELHAGWKEFSKLGMVPHTCNRSELRQKDCYEYGTSPVRSCPKKQNKKNQNQGDWEGRGEVAVGLGRNMIAVMPLVHKGFFNQSSLGDRRFPQSRGLIHHLTVGKLRSSAGPDSNLETVKIVKIRFKLLNFGGCGG